MMQPRQNVPGEVKSKKKIAKFNADAMTLDDPVQKNEPDECNLLSSKVVYFKMP